MAGDIGSISVGQAPAPVVVQTPGLPVAAKPAPAVVRAPSAETMESKAPPVMPAASPEPRKTPLPPPPITVPGIVIPPESGSTMGRKILIGAGILMFLIIAFIVAGMLIGGSTDGQPTVTASAVPTATASSTVRTLVSYFGAPSGQLLLPDDTTVYGALYDALTVAAPPAGQGRVISVTTTSGSPAAATDILGLADVLPAGFRPVLAGPWALVSFGQTEEFDDAGIAVMDAPASQRIVVVAEISDATAARQLLSQWESNGLASSAELFRVRPERQGTPSFVDGSYKTIPVRYLNFPYAHSSIDYAIVLASNGKNYLAFTTSRQSMFWVIDTLTK